jgi:hypothetical protein
LDADQDGLQLGSLRFQHVFTLSRGVTPAVISGVAVSAPWTFLSALESWGSLPKMWTIQIHHIWIPYFKPIMG